MQLYSKLLSDIIIVWHGITCFSYILCNVEQIYLLFNFARYLLEKSLNDINIHAFSTHFYTKISLRSFNKYGPDGNVLDVIPKSDRYNTILSMSRDTMKNEDRLKIKLFPLTFSEMYGNP